MLNSCKKLQKQSEALRTFLRHFFPSLKQNFIAYRSAKLSWHPDCIFENHQLWLSGFSRVYSNCCCSCSFEHEIIKIGQSSHQMYSNNILNCQESTTILNACTKEVWKHIEGTRQEQKQIDELKERTRFDRITREQVIAKKKKKNKQRKDRRKTNTRWKKQNMKRT